ncbi:putative dehydrogenase [Methanobrevibacter arboriphilus JCM 13429 = DSM 1125]|uniref:Putative dehydrogenase n=1 Tax=Methanobrevibacter arboriphilus JCM 13429 = DSM 1125 TaxID=1300164 RepID=A0A1V6N4U9_METAZ|nr:NAD(P)-binding domain-containing protein [Methanobrevibacter arboriphilus]OQD59613.1 putative dehydrogenase [Methanobrevibacter arboriphilus JCM 13429 = DSM 1125]
MKIGFIGFGEVASTISKKLLDNNVNVLSSINGRSDKTKKLAKNSGIDLVNSFEDVALSSDILISTVSPFEALEISKKYGVLTNGIFLDLNNISPKTTLEIFDFFKGINETKSSNFIKGSIIGKISSKNQIIYLSGENSNDLLLLKDYGLNIKVIGSNITDASYIKMIRSIYSKSLTAVTYEAFKISESFNMGDEFFEVLSITEGKDFEIQAKSRIKSLKNSHERKYEEMSEILKFLENIQSSNDFKDNNMIKATQNKFKEIK